ncbi:MAG: CPBP family intramembrane metalloprotease [Cyclobacteriaceae bacterium]|jgi:hypothetical protein|nr:CPBP family intramembrane metalloprotease [Cytophagales bacterium]MCZ8327661.1 CPBP family intramembrane metalloprotease [Cyclobacteriaceae bacterium]
MKKIINYLKEQWAENFQPAYYVLTALWLILLLVCNYKFGFRKNYLHPPEGFEKVFSYFLFYSIGYLFTLVLLSFCKRKFDFWKEKYFWLKFSIGIFVLSFDSAVPFLSQFISRNFDGSLYLWIYKVSVNGLSFFTVLLPLLLLYYMVDKQEKNRYGFQANNIDLKMYWLLLAIMVPLVISASFLPSFQKQYPMFKSGSAHEYLNIPFWITVVVYEIAYAFDFITVEFLFRGFFVIGFVKILGRDAILPMAVIYCQLHFGKPLGEAISSIFGGYILGVISYQTKNIWGGVLVHVGIAWLMEVAGFFQKYVF